MMAVSGIQVKAQAIVTSFYLNTFRQSFFLSTDNAFSVSLSFALTDLEAGYYNLYAIYTFDNSVIYPVSFPDPWALGFYNGSFSLYEENMQDQPLRILDCTCDLRSSYDRGLSYLRFALTIYCDRDIPGVNNFSMEYNAVCRVQAGTTPPYSQEPYIAFNSIQGHQPGFSVIQLQERFQFNALDQIINTLQSTSGTTVIGSLDKLNSNLLNLSGSFNDYSINQIEEMEVLNATQKATQTLIQSQLDVLINDSQESTHLDNQNQLLSDEMDAYLQYTDTSQQFDKINSSGILEPDMSFWSGLTSTVQFVSKNITLAFASFGDFSIPLTLMLTFVIISTIINVTSHKQ